MERDRHLHPDIHGLVVLHGRLEYELHHRIDGGLPENLLALQDLERQLLDRTIEDPTDRVRFLEWRTVTVERQLSNVRLNLIQAALNFIVAGGDPQLVDDQDL